MIVFTITNSVTGKVYVASTRHAPEERWAQLLTQAEEGAEGNLFDEIRSHGETAFSVEEWGFGEDPSEIRQLMREAQEDLGAEPLNTGKTELATVSKRKKLSDREAAKLLEDLERTTYQPQDMRNGKGDADADFAGSKVQKLQSETNKSKASADKEPLMLAAGRVASRAHEQRIRDAIEAERLRREEEKRAQIRRESSDINRVIANIELRRQAQRGNAALARKAKTAKAKAKASADVNAATKETARLSPGVETIVSKASPVKAPLSSAATLTVKRKPEERVLIGGTKVTVKAGAKATVPVVPTAESLPQGRVSSSAKEKQIRAAIEEERALRLAEKQIQAAKEASEMAAIMARIDARAKTTGKTRKAR
ncbi:MAG: hypothetical protein H6999_05895 [Hahellaceae bacterium]|nr:hypothetical protein [Hahellaceae bacterium]MCP5169272.1 hypothetical protein [Hahellaceae bacterium]